MLGFLKSGGRKTCCSPTTFTTTISLETIISFQIRSFFSTHYSFSERSSTNVQKHRCWSCELFLIKNLWYASRLKVCVFWKPPITFFCVSGLLKLYIYLAPFSRYLQLFFAMGFPILYPQNDAFRPPNSADGGRFQFFPYSSDHGVIPLILAYCTPLCFIAFRRCCTHLIGLARWNLENFARFPR